jgi:hypothetical protein
VDTGSKKYFSGKGNLKPKFLQAPICGKLCYVLIQCEFYNQRYVFDRVNADAVFSDIMATAANRTPH